MASPQLGVCYYPEHWPSSRWQTDARQMMAQGISLVRIGEFAWSRIEPVHGQFEWDWLDRAIDTLAAEGLRVVLGTPTACPPIWLVKTHPDILPVGENGRVRQFGSRRHYSFSSEVYREHSRRITKVLAERYGQHPALIGWQLDNEYGCHDTTLCYSEQALQAFHHWLQRRYHTIEALNAAWGSVFWSQEYTHFRDIGLPLAVTETNPAHRLAFRRFSSDQVRSFSDEQAAILREHSRADVWLSHNFMGDFVDFDHYPVMQALDIATWDSYPLGFLDQGWFDEETKRRFRRTGHPDWAAFHHDLYRGVGRGRFAVMEQQPGAVNWAPNNAEPLPGMVRLWSLEALAHGAEFVSWFRWRQAPFAQEQMHAGLLLSDATQSAGGEEAAQVAQALAQLSRQSTEQAPVALLFDYEACWLTEIQPHQADYNALRCAFEYYSAARSLGLDIDILPPDADLAGYELILLPCLPFINEALVAQLRATSAAIVIGPRAGSKTDDCTIPEALPPAALSTLIDIRIVSVDAIRSGTVYPLRHEPDSHATRWIETIDTPLEPHWKTSDGRGVLYQHERVCYLATCLNHDALVELIAAHCVQAGIDTLPLTDEVRVRRIGQHVFVFNYSAETNAAPVAGEPLLGERILPPAGVSVFPLAS